MRVLELIILGQSSVSKCTFHSYLFTPSAQTDGIVNDSRAEDYVNSKEWLQKNGLKAQKLTITKAFGDLSFRHAKGIVNIRTKPQDESVQTDAVGNPLVLVHFLDCSFVT